MDRPSLDWLRDRGVHLEVDGPTLRFIALEQDPSVPSLLAHWKPELMAALGASTELAGSEPCAATTTARPPMTTPGPCFTCGGSRWWHLPGSAFVVCAGCFEPPPAAEFLKTEGEE